MINLDFSCKNSKNFFGNPKKDTWKSGISVRLKLENNSNIRSDNE